ncbi:MAG: hypothetical protein ABJC74_01295 [Gemmatimonadota bacterium]
MIDLVAGGRDRPSNHRWRPLVLWAGLASVVVSQGQALTRPGGNVAPVSEVVAAALHPEAYVAYMAAVRSGDRSGLSSHSAAAIPAFARKYNLACSACHTAWPELSAFGQRFKDNGYQLGNDRDSPIWVNPSYFPLAIRTTPGWRFETTNHQPVDDGAGGTAEKTIKQSGFDISGADILMLGTLYKNITFGFVPTIADGEGVGIETAFVRFDNLFKSSWANLKVGKFELDNLLSEKRIVTLSTNGSFYQGYHFAPPGSASNFGLGDNQIGAEWMGHSLNSYTRYSVAVLGSVDGTPGLPGGKSYDVAATVSHAFDAGRLGIERIGLYGYVGQRPMSFETVDGEPIPGTGTDNKSFYRVGAVGDFFFGRFEVLPFVLHGSDSKELAGGTQAATWNSGLVELHFYVNPQFLIMQRSEIVRMSRQADPATPKNLGNTDAFTFGYRWYPIMFSRAGLAFHGEVSYTKTIGTAPLSGSGAGLAPLDPGTAVGSTSVLFALDFAF